VKIPLSAITLKPLRTSMDEEGLGELAQSIREHGLLEPIKLRQVNSHYELIDGLEAMRRTGAAEIEATVTTADEVEAMVQALILNVQREDLPPMDRARALQALINQTGWSQHEIGRRGIMVQQQAARLLALLQAPIEVQELVKGSGTGRETPEGAVTEKHVRVVREALGNSTQGVMTQVVKKAADEGLTSTQARRVAEAIKAAPPERKEYLLKTEYSPYIHDPAPDRQAAMARADATRGPTAAEAWQNLPEVRSILTMLGNWQTALDTHRKATTLGKLSPEAKQFIANRLRTVLMRNLNAWIEELEK
jgi:ParB/RepB/Spo0J family partition protein